MIGKFVAVGLASFFVALSGDVFASVYNGAGDNQTDAHGYYYAISGGLFPTGTTPNGDNASGGTFRFVTDDPIWGYTIDTWHKDDWYSNNASIALTLKNGATTVYDNNGLENGSFPAGYYDFTAGFPVPGAGAVTAYSMSNNFDWIYAGYFKLVADTTISSLTAYFAYSGLASDPLTAGFDPNDPLIAFGMNIWSNVIGDLLPTNTGSFNGDVFSSDVTAGSFSWSDTGFNRVGSASQQDIYRLTYALNTPITLAAGEYWFSSDARITPEPATLLVWSLFAVIGIVSSIRRRDIGE